ncbi:MAG: DUF6455 family protein, partial [Gammaproteobacteria bacterium]
AWRGNRETWIMPTFFDIGIAVVMVAVAVVAVVAFRRYHRAAADSRRQRMMAKVGLDEATLADPTIAEIVSEVRQRCTRCTSEAQCERWLAGEAGGDNAFCPNAQVFEKLLEGRTEHAV